MTLDLDRTEASGDLRIAERAIREQLSRILESQIFAQSDRLSRFLRFTVETTLAGNAEALKEYLIGTDVYERKPPYHPSEDSIVRSEARRLRTKLKQYYESFGKADPVFIYYRPGSYVPVFRDHHTQSRSQMTIDRALRELLAERLITQAVDLSEPQDFDVQIVLEGTVRILRSGAKSSAPIEFRPVKVSSDTEID